MTKEEYQLLIEAVDDVHDPMRERIDELEAGLALLTAIATRTETRLCKLLEHLGAAHLIQSQPRA